MELFSTDYAITIENPETADDNDEDNTSVLTFNKTDLSIDASYVSDDEQKFIKVSATNISYVDTNAEIVVKNPSNQIIHQSYEFVKANSTYDVLIPLSAGMIPEGDEEYLYHAEVHASENEAYECNNTTDVLVWDTEPVMIEVDDKVTIENGIEVNGYQINNSVSGMRVVYSVEPEINGIKVVKSGLVFALADYVEDDDIYVREDNENVAAFFSTPKGVLSTNYSDFEAAQSYAMTMLYAVKTAGEYCANFKIKAFAQLEDGNYIYTDSYTFSAFDIAHYLYNNSLMHS